eukprot:2688164-Rhodomonas_salina.1
MVASVTRMVARTADGVPGYAHPHTHCAGNACAFVFVADAGARVCTQVCAFMIPRIFGIHRHRWNRDRDEREAESKDRSDRRRLLVTVGEAHATLRADMTLERDVRVPLRKARARPGRIEARAVIDSAHWAR